MAGKDESVSKLAQRLRAGGVTAVTMDAHGVPTLHVKVQAKARAEGADLGSNSAQQLKSIIERIERLEEEKRNIGSDIKDVYTEAKGNGYHTKIIRKIIALRKKDPHERQEEDALLDTYMHALGMV